MLKIYEWYPENDSVKLLCENDLEENEDDSTQGSEKTKYAIESYLADSLIVSDDGEKISQGIEKKDYLSEGNQSRLKIVLFNGSVIQQGKN